MKKSTALILILTSSLFVATAKAELAAQVSKAPTMAEITAHPEAQINSADCKLIVETLRPYVLENMTTEPGENEKLFGPDNKVLNLNSAEQLKVVRDVMHIVSDECRLSVDMKTSRQGFLNILERGLLGK
jgi:hypothetical protein